MTDTPYKLPHKKSLIDLTDKSPVEELKILVAQQKLLMSGLEVRIKRLEAVVTEGIMEEDEEDPEGIEFEEEEE